jgi:hypothetical protein
MVGPRDWASLTYPVSHIRPYISETMATSSSGAQTLRAGAFSDRVPPEDSDRELAVPRSRLPPAALGGDLSFAP